MRNVADAPVVTDGVITAPPASRNVALYCGSASAPTRTACKNPCILPPPPVHVRFCHASMVQLAVELAGTVASSEIRPQSAASRSFDESTAVHMIVRVPVLTVGVFHECPEVTSACVTAEEVNV